MLEHIPVNKDEVFKYIQNSNNEYAVSNHGRVYSLKRRKFLTLQEVRDTRVDGTQCTAYYRVKLRLDKKPYMKVVHRLVAKEFLHNTDIAKTQVNHIDSNGLNNHISNLEWVTPSENVIHAIKANKHITSDIQRVKANLKKGNLVQSQNERLARLSHVGKSFGGSSLLSVVFKDDTLVALDYAELKCNNCGKVRRCTETTFKTYILDRGYVGYCQSCTNKYGKYKI